MMVSFFCRAAASSNKKYESEMGKLSMKYIDRTLVNGTG